jgi:RNA polymerase sigma-70 factor, ECF subfamily
VGSVAAFRVSQTDHSIPTDGELIERTLGGDGAAFALLVERFQRKIYRVAWAIVRDDAEADTVTQDTFIQAYTNLARFEGRSELETWLTRIAINRSRDALRRRRFLSLFTRIDDTEEVFLEPVDTRPDPEREFASRQLRAAIERAERKLSAQQKVIFRLRHYENRPLEEIADLLGLRSGTVRAHLFRAIHKVRKELAGWTNRKQDDSDDHETLQ